MNVREWALIAFTILAQMSVGSFLVLGVVHFFAARKDGMRTLREDAWCKVLGGVTTIDEVLRVTKGDRI